MTKTILLLDDDPDEESILREAFTFLGADITLLQFYTADSLSSYLEDPGNMPEILLIDVNLPGTTGLEFLRELHKRALLDNVLTVIYTIAGDEQTIAQSFECGAGVYMKKTTTQEHLRENLTALLN
jgi:DNA-binding response OmpR family regulator